MAHESTILSPRDPSLDNTDDWPEFDLSNVTVHLPGNPESVASLLLATENYPLTVRGQLEISEECSPLLLQPTFKKRVNLEITDVRTFSYGQYTNGTVALWAAGKSGWYSISPSRTYKPLFQEMGDAVDIFYFITDAYRNPRKSGRGKRATILPPYRAQEVFQKYANEVMEDPSELAEATEKFYQHKDFILSSMLSGKEGLVWSQNPLLIHLRRRFPSEYAQVKNRIKGSRNGSAEPQKRSRQGSSETISSNTGLKRKRGRQASATPQIQETASTGSCSESEVVTATTPDEAPEESRKTRQTSIRSSVSRRTRQSASVESQPDHEMIRSDHSDVEGSTKMQGHRKRKSFLRPKSSKATKSTNRSGKAPVMEDEPPDDEDLDSPSSDKAVSHAKKSGHNFKMQNSNAHEDEGIDMADSHSEEDHMAPTTTAAEVQEFESLPPGKLDHRPDGVQEDTWVCALDGCTHKVYAIANPDSQKLIREHYALHAYDDDDRVQMVKRLQAPSLPVRHLMERVRQQAKVEGFPGSRVAGTRFPNAAVVQKY